MKDIEYIVKQGDTLGQIAYRYTGNKNEWTGLLGSNPQIPKYTDRYGQKRFVPSHFQVGQIIRLPQSWHVQAQERGGLLAGVGEMGTVGADPPVHPQNSSCPTPKKIATKPYFYEAIGQSEAWGMIEQNFNLPGGKNIPSLNAANADRVPGFVYWNDTCGPAKYQAGQLIAIPASWPEPTDTSVIARLRDSSGGPYVPGQAAPVCPSGTVWDPDQKACVGAGGITQTTPTCQGGYHYDTVVKNCVKDGGGVDTPCGEGLVRDPTTGQCVKGGGATVGAKEEGIKSSTILWLLLAAGAGIGGALLLNNMIKSRKVYGPPPTPSAPKGEIVVRR